MGEAERKADGLALFSSTVTNTLNFQALGIAFRNTDDHVVDQGTGQAVERAMGLIIAGAGHGDDAVFEFHANFFVDLAGKFAFRSLDGDQIIVHGYRNLIRDGNRILTNS